MNSNISLDINKAFTGDIQPLDMVLPGLLAGSVGSLVAPGSTGKGFFINSLACSMTTRDILGMGITPQDCKITYLTAEDPLPILEHRICALGAYLSSAERQTFSSRVEIISLAGWPHPPSLLNKNGESDPEWIEFLTKICTGKRLVIIDTLRRFHSAEENDSGAMTVLLQILEGIAKQTQAAIIFTHHTKKGATLSGEGLDADSSRGSGALIYNVRWQLNMQTMTTAEADKFSVPEQFRRKYVQVYGPKINYDETGLEGWLMRGDGGVLLAADLKDQRQNKDKTKDSNGNGTKDHSKKGRKYASKL